VQLAGCHTMNGTLMGAQQDTKSMEHAMEGKKHHCHKHHGHHRHHGHHKHHRHHAHHQAAKKVDDAASTVTQ
ncbi:MAG: hypothetical protein Q8L68_05770, partial [Methylococcales bacterium]|nr:hypothetical protein [Methylococcales bacterium]